ncbi:Receptor-interacting serine/threonine-protein kinase 1 [Merluccius polli]|uniref:Receptor-interacting serine/threonine-protein kinase 1 n=1 Tax=Merluccius polli TaxID=89951 RepID=A0AA47P1U2_MERPO|nr:Receptor-interacting serine/threonine-protein kinase 1 [Merluccius polli]
MASPPDTAQMRSSDLIKKEPLDYGGFGKVYLCYHKTLGRVVLKTVFNGALRNDDSKRSLVEEGTLMTRLCHDRVVKLLGVIVEEGDYSLVMELIPKGNLQDMLQKVSVPMSIKGRIILEILEGMVYLTKNNVIHKDLKPENILVDKDFHIKIADLGLATCQSWSKLTREVSKRKSRLGCTMGTKAAGTLSYMAPEHLENLNCRSTEKSDVYSFAIVVWVILTGQDPYENARSEDQVYLCVRKGDRPEVELITEDTPKEMVELMKSCWQQDPLQRPTFEGMLTELYDGPEWLVEKMKSLSTPPDVSPDGPAPLLSSESVPPGPVEASIEDLTFLSCRTDVEVDAQGVGGEGGRATLQQKLDMELQYHKKGSYTYVSQPDSVQACQSDPMGFYPLQSTISDCEGRQPKPTEDHHPMPSSVHPVPADSSEDSHLRPNSGLYKSMASSASSAKYISVASSTHSLTEQRTTPQEEGHPLCNRQHSCPVYSVPNTMVPDHTAGHCFAPNKIGPLQDSGSQGMFIQNASAIQIGNNNSLSIRGSESCASGMCNSLQAKECSALKEALQKYEHQAVTEEHLELLRDNIGNNWKRCARRLGLTNVEVDSVDHDYNRDGLQEKVHQMLECWRMKEGSVGCTVGKLCQALDGHITAAVIQKLLSTCKRNNFST